MSTRLAFWYAVLLLLLLSLSTPLFSFPSDLEAVMNAATITTMKTSILRAIEYVVDTTDTAVLALREVPFNYYFSIVTAFVAQVFQEGVRFGTTTIKTISSLPYSNYATTGVSVTHQILRTGEEIVSWLFSELDSARRAIEIMFDPSTAQMIVRCGARTHVRGCAQYLRCLLVALASRSLHRLYRPVSRVHLHSSPSTSRPELGYDANKDPHSQCCSRLCTSWCFRYSYN